MFNGWLLFGVCVGVWALGRCAAGRERLIGLALIVGALLNAALAWLEAIKDLGHVWVGFGYVDGRPFAFLGESGPPRGGVCRRAVARAVPGRREAGADGVDLRGRVAGGRSEPLGQPDQPGARGAPRPGFRRRARPPSPGLPRDRAPALRRRRLRPQPASRRQCRFRQHTRRRRPPASAAGSRSGPTASRPPSTVHCWAGGRGAATRRRRRAVRSKAARSEGPEVIFRDMHNFFVETLVATGFLGFLAFCGWLFTSAAGRRRARRLRRRGRGGVARATRVVAVRAAAHTGARRGRSRRPRPRRRRPRPAPGAGAPRGVGGPARGRTRRRRGAPVRRLRLLQRHGQREIAPLDRWPTPGHAVVRARIGPSDALEHPGADPARRHRSPGAALESLHDAVARATRTTHGRWRRWVPVSRPWATVPRPAGTSGGRSR